jgi:serine/threonine protein kinase
MDIMIFKDREDGELQRFGTDPQAEKDDEKRNDWMPWLFSFHGQLQVISVPFVAGEHIPKTIGDLQHITHELNTLHKEGIKHGDIRLWNITFARDRAKLLDFDFSGRKVYYPDGYTRWLPDSDMRPGTKHEEITEACDIEALLAIFLMFDAVFEDDDDDTEFLWWGLTKMKALKKLVKDSSDVLSWMIEQFEPHSEVRIELNNLARSKELHRLKEMRIDPKRGKPVNYNTCR